MRLLLRVAKVTLLAAAVALPASSADHREAPTISELPTADINDIYAFRAPGDASKLVLVMTVNPLSVPDFAPTYAFSPRVLYRFTIDTTGDAVPEHDIDIIFSPRTSSGQTLTAFLPTGIVVEGETTAPTVLSAEPNPPVINEGPEGSEVRVFAGPTDDPFFFDFVGFNRAVAPAPGDPVDLDAFTGEDSFAGLNVSAIVVELPVALVSDGQTRLQIAGFTHPFIDVSRLLDDLAAWYPFLDLSDFVDEVSGAVDPELINKFLPALDRMGNPAVSTALIPSGLKDAFNRGLPEDDPNDYGPVLVASLRDIYGTSEENIAVAASVAAPDTLKLDLEQADGYPNGRKLDDDVVDILLSLFLNRPPFDGDADTDEPIEPIDGVPGNDEPFLDSFPYLAPPHQASPPPDDGVDQPS